MWIGWLEFDLLLGDVHSLEQKRSVIRPVIAELRRRFHAQLRRRAARNCTAGPVSASRLVAADRRPHAVDVPRFGRAIGGSAARVELLSVRRGSAPQYRRLDDQTLRLRRSGVGVTAPGASLRALIRNAAWRRMERLWTHRLPDDVRAALQALPSLRLGPALLLAQRLDRPRQPRHGRDVDDQHAAGHQVRRRHRAPPTARPCPAPSDPLRPDITGDVAEPQGPVGRKLTEERPTLRTACSA